MPHEILCTELFAWAKGPILVLCWIQQRISVLVYHGLRGSNLIVVGTGRFELPTPRTPSECSTRLSHVPTGENPLLKTASGVNIQILHHFCFHVRSNFTRNQGVCWAGEAPVPRMNLGSSQSKRVIKLP